MWQEVMANASLDAGGPVSELTVRLLAVVLFVGVVVVVEVLGGGGHVACSWYGPHPPWGRPRPSGPASRSERQSENGCSLLALLCWSFSRVANGHPPHGRVHRAPRPLRPPAQGPLLWLPCGVEARSGYPAASRHAATSPGAVSAPDHHGAEQVDETRGGVDLHGFAALRPRRTTSPWP